VHVKNLRQQNPPIHNWVPADTELTCIKGYKMSAYSLLQLSDFLTYSLSHLILPSAFLSYVVLLVCLSFLLLKHCHKMNLVLHSSHPCKEYEQGKKREWRRCEKKLIHEASQYSQTLLERLINWNCIVQNHTAIRLHQDSYNLLISVVIIVLHLLTFIEIMTNLVHSCLSTQPAHSATYSQCTE